MGLPCWNDPAPGQRYDTDPADGNAATNRRPSTEQANSVDQRFGIQYPDPSFNDRSGEWTLTVTFSVNDHESFEVKMQATQVSVEENDRSQSWARTVAQSVTHPDRQGPSSNLTTALNATFPDQDAANEERIRAVHDHLEAFHQALRGGTPEENLQWRRDYAETEQQ
ncbi:hypothetical protein IAU60_005857 [Kwoniella sp. DSM 27419]